MEYIIVNKTTIQKRIEELEILKRIHCYRGTRPNENEFQRYNNEQSNLKQILSQSTPLIPEIENAIQFGKDIRSEKSFINPNFDSPFIDYEDSTEETTKYISNLKLDI